MSFQTDFNRIGPAFRDLRKLKGLTQKEVCEDICSQPTLSRLENGDVYGLWDKLFLIAERLGIEVSYFFEIAKSSETEFVAGVKDRVRALVEKRDYASVSRMIKAHKKNPSFSKNKQNLQFLIWHEGVCSFNLTKQFDHAHKILLEALTLTYIPPKFVTEQELSIMNSIGVFCFETSKFELAVSTYQSALKEIRHTPVQIDKKVKIRLLYNLSKALSKVGEYKKSNDYCLEGVTICKGNSYYYLLGEFYFQMAYNHFHEEGYIKAKEHLQKAIQVFSIYDDTEYLELSRNALEEVTEKLQG
jgi:transcriptional regulator with XRE-family HTH domain